MDVVGGEGANGETLEGGTEEPTLSKLWRKAAENDVYQAIRSVLGRDASSFVGTFRRLVIDDVNVDIEIDGPESRANDLSSVSDLFQVGLWDRYGPGQQRRKV